VDYCSENERCRSVSLADFDGFKKDRNHLIIFGFGFKQQDIVLPGQDAWNARIVSFFPSAHQMSKEHSIVENAELNLIFSQSEQVNQVHGLLIL
jgi:hypothetical protein